MSTAKINPATKQALNLGITLPCEDEDPDRMFPESGDVPAEQDAQQVCLGCDFRRECGQWALDTNQEWGVWGGLTENDRRAIRRRHFRQKARQRETLPVSA